MLKEIREEMARRLNEAMTDVAWSPYVKTLTPPSGFIYPGGLGDTVIEFDQAMQRGADDLSFVVQVGVATIGDELQQANLDEMIEPWGPLSVKAILEEERALGERVTLGGLVESLAVTACSGYRRYLVEGRGPVLGAEWQVEVTAKGKP